MSNTELVKEFIKVILSGLFGAFVPKKNSKAARLRLGESHAQSEQKVVMMTVIISALVSILYLASTIVGPNDEGAVIVDDYKELYTDTITRLEKFTTKTGELLAINNKLTSQLTIKENELAQAKELNIKSAQMVEQLSQDIDEVTTRYYALMSDMADTKLELANTKLALAKEQQLNEQRLVEFKAKEDNYKRLLIEKQVTVKHTTTEVESPKFVLSKASRNALINQIKKSNGVTL